MDKTWFGWLRAYAKDGFSEQATAALDAAPFMEGEFDRSLLPDQDRLKGWEALKGLHSHSRRSRKSLHASRNWIVHLFSGDKNAKRIEAPKDKCYQVLSLDLQKCRSEDLRSDALWNALI